MVECRGCGARVLEQDVPGHKCDFPVSRENRLLGDWRWNERERRRAEAQARFKGEELFEAVNPGKRDPNASNAGAYDSIEERKRELMAQGLTEMEAVKRARSESTAPVDRQIEPVSKREDYMGAATEELMDVNKDVDGGGNRSGRTRTPVVSAETFAAKRQRRYDEVLSDERKPETERERAARKMEENRRRLERVGPGRPPDGKEAKMRLVGYMEPHKVAEIYDSTGKTTTELLEDAHRFLTQIREGATDEELGSAVRGLLATVNDPNYQPPHAQAC